MDASIWEAVLVGLANGTICYLDGGKSMNGVGKIALLSAASNYGTSWALSSKKVKVGKTNVSDLMQENLWKAGINAGVYVAITELFDIDGRGMFKKFAFSGVSNIVGATMTDKWYADKKEEEEKKKE